MIRPRPRTTALRVLLASAFVWLVGSYLMGAAFLFPWVSNDELIGTSYLLDLLVQLPLFGAVFGAPFLILAGVAWLLLHRAGRVSALLATGAGAGVGITVAIALVAFFRAPLVPIITALIAAPLIGWTTWWIAYGSGKYETPTEAAEAFS